VRATKVPLAVGLVLAVCITGGAAQIPQDLQAMANTFSFLAALGTRCETRLEVYGYTGVSDEVCQDFERQYARVTEEFSAKRASIEAAMEAAVTSPSLAVRMEWEFFMRDFETATQKVFKAMQHIIFLRQTEVDKRKQSERGKRK
jgi:hypothetical protein